MKTWITFVCFGLLTWSPVLQAQVKAYIDIGGPFSAPEVVVDGRAYGPHFFTGFADLPEAMKANAEAREFAQRATEQAMWGSVCLWGGLAAALVYSGSTDRTNYNSGTYWGIFLTGFLPGAFLFGASQRNTFRAINSYNGIKVKTSRLAPEKIQLMPTQQGGVAALSWSF